VPPHIRENDMEITTRLLGMPARIWALFVRAV
jgi:hypothetical protein